MRNHQPAHVNLESFEHHKNHGPGKGDPKEGTLRKGPTAHRVGCAWLLPPEMLQARCEAAPKNRSVSTWNLPAQLSLPNPRSGAMTAAPRYRPR